MRKVPGIIVAFLAFLFFAVPAFAQSNISLCPKDATGEGVSSYNILCDLTPATALPTILTFVLVLAVIIALVYLVWGGIKWITSGGDKANVETARNQIIAAVIGLIVAFLAWFIIGLVLTLFFGQDAAGGLSLPSLNDTVGGGGSNNSTCTPSNKPDCRTGKVPDCSQGVWVCVNE